jgi:hypothetical protein
MLTLPFGRIDPLLAVANRSPVTVLESRLTVAKTRDADEAVPVEHPIISGKRRQATSNEATNARFLRSI